jgi:hypothetical protein
MHAIVFARTRPFIAAAGSASRQHNSSGIRQYLKLPQTGLIEQHAPILILFSVARAARKRRDRRRAFDADALCVSGHLHARFEVRHVARADFSRRRAVQQRAHTLLVQLKYENAVSNVEVRRDVAEACAPKKETGFRFVFSCN